MLNNLPERWDLETDLVAVGSGGGALAAAITARAHGLSAMVLERSDLVGGVTALSMGEVWVPGNHLAEALGLGDSVESGLRYVERLAGGYAEPEAMLNQAIHAPLALKWFEERIGLKLAVIRNCPDYYYGHSDHAVAEGRLLEPLPFPAESLGEWQHRTRVSPQVAYGLTHEDIFSMGGTARIADWDFTLMGERLMQDERCLGPALAGYFVKGALDLGVDLRTGFDVRELIGDGERIVGLRAVYEGRDLFVRADKGVVVAVSSYERNKVLARTLGQMLDPGSLVMRTIDGAHFRLAGPAGARVARVPDVTMLGYTIPGEETPEGDQMWRSAMTFMGLPHTLVVNRAGRRFANEAFYRSVYFAVDAIDGGSQTTPNFPCWAVMDAQARAKYPLGSIMPGQDLPEGVGVTADSLAELAAKTGIDAAGLAETVARFNRYSDTGVDPEFQRHAYPWGAWMTGDCRQQPHPNLGPLVQAPFHAIPLGRLAGSGIAAAGVVVDHHCRAIGWDDRPIAGLYLAGNSVARLDTGALMQSGMSNARGMTQGWLAGLHAAGCPSDRLDRVLAGGQARSAA